MGKRKGEDPGILAVGNYDSDEGYAWRLMETFWCELSRFGREQNLRTYVCFPTVSEVPECLTEAECQVDQLDFKSGSIVNVLRQLRFIFKYSIKVIYLSDFKTFSFRYVLFRIAGVRRIIVHDHTPGVRHPASGLKAYIKRIANRLPLISCSAAFAVSPYIETRLTKVNGVPESKVFCVTNGIDVEGWRHVHESRNDHDGPIRIVTVGRVCYYKGIEFALQVIARLVSDGLSPVIEYQVIGDGPDRSTFAHMAKELELENTVKFVGNVDDVAERLANCDIAFHPSKGEAMSLAILEYMRAGLAICTSDNPSVCSALRPGEDAVVYREGDVGSAATELQRILESRELREKLGSKAARRVVEEFSSQDMLARFRFSVNAAIFTGKADIFDPK